MNLFILAGEASGDAHAGALLRALHELRPGVRSFGIGGDRMALHGFEALRHVREMGVTGITEAARRVPFFRRVLDETAEEVVRRRPDTVVLVDYPDFNILLGREIHARAPEIPVVYFIGPQVWAWRRGRIRDIGLFARRVLVIFPFEEALYREAGVEAHYVGHPLVDEAFPTVSREVFLESMGLDPKRKTVALLPGSRMSEVERHLAPVLAGARLLAEARPDVQFVLSSAPTLDPGFIPSTAAWRSAQRLRIALSFDRIYNMLGAADAAAVASGTSTVEAALLDVPMTVVYGLSGASHWLARRLVRVPWISMVNILAGEEIVKELVQKEFNPENVAREVGALLDPARRDEVKRGLARVRAALGESGAARRAAEWVLRTAEEGKA